MDEQDGAMWVQTSNHIHCFCSLFIPLFFHNLSYLVFLSIFHSLFFPFNITSYPAATVSLSPPPSHRGFVSNQSSNSNVIIGLFYSRDIFLNTIELVCDTKLYIHFAGTMVQTKSKHAGYTCRATLDVLNIWLKVVSYSDRMVSTLSWKILLTCWFEHNTEYFSISATLPYVQLHLLHIST